MHRALRIVTALLLVCQGAGAVAFAVFVDKLFDVFPVSMNGMDPARGRVGALAGLGGYVGLTALAVLLLIWGARGRVSTWLLRLALIAEIGVLLPLVMTSLSILGWPVFAWTMVLLTALTLALVDNWDPGKAARPAVQT